VILFNRKILDNEAVAPKYLSFVTLGEEKLNQTAKTPAKYEMHP
jgi:hypothetical protein